mmetsp:Transcript_24612/g.38789  ORF Transcript_24612/g.38789 Transcript_24612/m.38789 type:complete len:219 (+) Transcript_24612:345-1001(+)
MNRQRRGNGGSGGQRNNNRNNRRRDRGPTPSMPPPGQPGRGCHRDAIHPGSSSVYVVKKEDQRSGRETSGVVMRLLTNSSYHPRGIKVMLEGGVVGRVTRFIGDEAVNNDGANNGSDDDDGRDYDYGPSSDTTRTLADFILPSGSAGTNANNNGSSQSSSPILSSNNVESESFTVDDGAMATLVSMNFDPERAREALESSNNDVQEAVEYLIMDGYLD